MRKIIDVFWISSLNLLPEGFGNKAFIKTSKDGAEVSKNATTYKALETFYKWEKTFDFSKGFMDGVFTYAWQCVHNVQAVRNRKKIVDSLLENESPEIIVSLGSGTARALIEYGKSRPNVKLRLIDLNDDALKYSKSIAEELGIQNHDIRWHKDIVHNFSLYLEEIKGRILYEMVGLLDYFNDEKAIAFFNIVSAGMNKDDVFIVSNIVPNRERPFVEKVIRWKNMHYRQPSELLELLILGGFSRDKINLFMDATGIYVVVHILKK